MVAHAHATSAMKDYTAINLFARRIAAGEFSSDSTARNVIFHDRYTE